MQKVLVALVAFLMAMILKEKIEKEFHKKIEEELSQESLFQGNPDQLAIKLERAVAKADPNLFFRHENEIRAGLLKIARNIDPENLAQIKTDGDLKNFMA